MLGSGCQWHEGVPSAPSLPSDLARTDSIRQGWNDETSSQCVLLALTRMTYREASQVSENDNNSGEVPVPKTVAPKLTRQGSRAHAEFARDHG